MQSMIQPTCACNLRVQGILESMISDGSAAKDSASETTRKVVEAHSQGQVRVRRLAGMAQTLMPQA